MSERKNNKSNKKSVLEASDEELDLDLDDDFETDSLGILDLELDVKEMSSNIEDKEKWENKDNGKKNKLAKDKNNLLKDSENLLDKMKNISLKKFDDSSAKSDGFGEDIVINNQEADTNIKLQIIELKVEELGNLGLNVSVVKELLSETKKYLKENDETTVKSLIKNSENIANNLMIENRMNVVSTIISFIDTFIFDLTDIEIDFKYAKAYFTQVKTSLEEKNISSSNRYLGDTIQNVRKVYDFTREKNLNEAFKFLKFYIEELEDLGINVSKIKEIIDDGKNSFSSNDLDAAEQYLRKFTYSTRIEIKKLELDTDKKEDLIQEIEGVYNFEDFTALGDAIARAKAMLIESIENENIQKQLDAMYNMFEKILLLEKSEKDVSKLKEDFYKAKDSFDKEDFITTHNLIQQLQSDLKQTTTPTEKSEPEEKVIIDDEKVKNYKKRLSKAEKEIDKLKGSGLSISDVKTKVDELKEKVDYTELEKSEESLNLIFEEINDLKERQKRTKDKVEKLIEKLSTQIISVKADGVDTDETLDLINYAKQRLNNERYSDVLEILEHSQDVLNNSVNEKYKEKAKKAVKDVNSLINIIPQEHSKLIELQEMVDRINTEFKGKAFETALNSYEEFKAIYDSIDIIESKVESETKEEIDELKEIISKKSEEAKDTEETILDNQQIENFKIEELEISETKIPQSSAEFESEELEIKQEIAQESKQKIDQEININDNLEQIEVIERKQELHSDNIQDSIEDDVEYTNIKEQGIGNKDIELDISESDDIHEEVTDEVPKEVTLEVIEESYEEVTKDAQEGDLIEELKELSDEVIEEDLDNEPEDLLDEDSEEVIIKEPLKPQIETTLDETEPEVDRSFISQDEEINEKEMSDNDLINEEISNSDAESKFEKHPFDSIGTQDILKEAFGFKGRVIKNIPDEKKSGIRQRTSRVINNGPSLTRQRQSGKPQSKRMPELERPEYRSDHYMDNHADITQIEISSIEEAYKQTKDQIQEGHELFELSDNKRFGNDTRRLQRNVPPRFRPRRDRMHIRQKKVNQLPLPGPKYSGKTKSPFVQISRPRNAKFIEDIYETGSDVDQNRISEIESADQRNFDEGQYEARMDTLKKEALKGLQEIQSIISSTYHFGADTSELERISEDARNAFDDKDYQEVLLYVDSCEELSRNLRIGYMDRLIAENKYSGQNTDYLEYLLQETENAYNEEKYKIGDELARKFVNVLKDLELEERTSTHSWIYCRFCGNAIPADSTFCSFCGDKLF